MLEYASILDQSHWIHLNFFLEKERKSSTIRTNAGTEQAIKTVCSIRYERR